MTYSNDLFDSNWRGSGNAYYRRDRARAPQQPKPAAKPAMRPTVDHERALASVRELCEIMEKFTYEQIEGDPEMLLAANLYTLRYEGTFDFMIEMKAKLARWGTLTTAQAKGALNCLRADVQREIKARERAALAAAGETSSDRLAAAEPVVPSGIYTVVDGSEHVTIRLRDASENWHDMPAGSQVAYFLSGSDNENSYTGFAFVAGQSFRVWKRFRSESRIVDALKTLLGLDESERRAAGQRYAVASGRCYRCGRTLTVPSSIDAGLGPICAGQA